MDTEGYDRYKEQCRLNKQVALNCNEWARQQPNPNGPRKFDVESGVVTPDGRGVVIDYSMLKSERPYLVRLSDGCEWYGKSELTPAPPSNEPEPPPVKAGGKPQFSLF